MLDVGGGVGVVGGAQHAEGVGGVVPGLLVGGDDLGGAATLFGRPLDDVVVDVGDVGDVADLDATPLEVAAQDVVDQQRPPVADMGDVVDGGPADVHRDLARLARFEVDDTPEGSVMQAQHVGYGNSRDGSDRP